MILIGSGKGGVGKSFVSCGLGLKLAELNYRVGLLDIDIHGASVPNFLGVKGPLASTKDGLEPKNVDGLRVMSVALLAGENSVPMRGGIEKQSTVSEMFSLTNWGDLDFLIVDLPPGTGDEVLSAFHLFRGHTEIVLVTTPSKNATSIVRRLALLAKAEKIPIGGIVVNMAYLKLENKILHPFGKANRKMIERFLDSRVIGEIPLVPEINMLPLRDAVLKNNTLSQAFGSIGKVLGA